MNKEQILLDTKKQMTHLIQERLSMDTIDEVFIELNRFESFLRALKEIKVTEIIDTQNVEDSDEKTGDIVEEQIDIESSDKKVERKAYQLTRQLRGGYLKEIEAFVPEGAIRMLNAEDGDYLYATEKENGRYFYELAKKGERRDTSRREINFGTVRKDGSLLVVDRTLLNGGEDIKWNEMYHSFVISDEDRLAFQLREGDIVDLAYYENNPNGARVIWKHDLHEDECDEAAPLKSGAYKNKDGKKQEKTNELEGKTVFVLGCEPRRAVFEQAVENAGGKFIWAEGTEGEDRLRKLVEQADIVVILIRFIRHHASQYVVKVCKETCTDYSIVDTLGVEAVVNGAATPDVIAS